MKTKLLSSLFVTSTLLCSTWSVHAATVTVTVADDGSSNIGAPGTFYWALTNCNPGDTIAFNIPGSQVHYLLEPPGGFPLVYHKANLVIDGYTQPGAAANTQSITQANNAVIKIVIDARNGNSRNMEYTAYDGTLGTSDPPIDNTSMSTERGGYGSDERALLGIYRSPNVTVRGLAFLSTFNDPNGDQKGICLAHDYGLNPAVLDRLAYTEGSEANFHVCGCWFGVDPGNPTRAGVSGGTIAIAGYRHRDVSGGPRPELPNVGVIVGVAPGSANPRAEFNVFAGYGYVMDCENIRSRFSGNFVGVLPDGVTDYNLAAIDFDNWRNAGTGHFEWGRYDDTQPMIIGTDGDGVNDADEGNLFGPIALYNGGLSQANAFDFYSTSRKAYIIAGNRFGIGVDGTRWTNSAFKIFGGLSLDGGTQVRFGSDFNGVSDAEEANVVYNNNVFSVLYPDPTTSLVPSMFEGMDSGNVTRDAWVSIRGNSFVNNFPTFNPDDLGNSASHYLDWWSGIVTDTNSTIPVLLGSSTVTTISGTFSPATNAFTYPPTNSFVYTNAAVVDLYVADPEGLVNGTNFNLPTFPAGFTQGKTYLASYVVPNPLSGTFSFDVSGLGLAHGTKVTATVTYSAFARPNITSIAHSGNSTTLSWTGDNGGPILSAAAGAASSGFGVQSASSLSGPWTTAFAAGNSATLAAGGSTAFYRVVGPVSGMTTLFANPVTLP